MRPKANDIGPERARWSHCFHDDAERAYEDALRRDPGSALVHFSFGHFLRAEGKLEQAEAHFREAERLAPNSPRAALSLADCLQFQKRLDEAVKVYRRALEIKADDDPLGGFTPAGKAQELTNFGLALNALRSTEEATAAFREAVRLDPKQLSALTVLASIAASAGRKEEAEDWYRKVLATSPDDTVALTNLVWSLVERSAHLDEALPLALRAMQLRPSDFNCIANAGWVYFKLGDFPNAEKHLSKILAGTEWGKVNDSGQASTWAILGEIYEKTGRKDLAAGAYRNAIKLDPKEQRALDGLRRVGGD